MKVGIIGTRGIPNNYGGFEQWAELLSVGLVNRGCEVYVYNSHNHPFKESIWNGVNIIHKYDPEYLVGTSGQFIYDFNCILDSRKRNFDIILQLGFTSSAIWGWLLPSQKTYIATNMDGLEWKRQKFSKLVQSFLKVSEKYAVNTSNCLIADSPVIKEYLLDNYLKPTHYIPYGTKLFSDDNKVKIKELNLQPYEYNLLIARLEPENNIETIIKGVLNSNTEQPLIIVGNHKIPHGKYLFNKYQNEKNIKFTGGIFKEDILNNLRYFSNVYFHGHSAGGTNPSLLEAMACSANICAHDNPYNRSVLNNKAVFFKNQQDIAYLMRSKEKIEELKIISKDYPSMIQNNFFVEDVINQYFVLFNDIIRSKNNNIV